MSSTRIDEANKFTVVLAPLKTVLAKHFEWYAWIASNERLEFVPRIMDQYRSVRDAWDSYVTIMNQGGVLFAPYKGRATYSFSFWSDSLNLARWCNCTAVSVCLQSEESNIRKYIVVQEGIHIKRRIDLSFTELEGWDFHESGARYDFESEQKLTSSRMVNRIDVQSAIDVLGHFGVEIPTESTFLHETEFCLVQHGTNELHAKRLRLSERNKP